MNMFRNPRSPLTETVQSGLPTWKARSGDALLLDDDLHACDRFFYRAFGDCGCPMSLYDAQGERLVEALAAPDRAAFPDRIPALADRPAGPGFLAAGAQLFYVYDRLDRWAAAPAQVAWIAVLIEPAWLEAHTQTRLTPSEHRLLALLLSGLDLRSAAEAAGARYDTKRKQIRQIMEKAGVGSQAALLREMSLRISASVLDELLRPEQRNPEVALAQDLYGRDIVIHSITIGESHDVPIWELGARRGQPVLYFHSMLAPLVFTSDAAEALKARNLRLLMMPRHFFTARDGAGPPQRQLLAALADAVEYLCGEPVICLGESAGCAWAAHFARHFPKRVSEAVFVAAPQAGTPDALAELGPGAATILSEVSSKIRSDERVIAGLTRIYNSIARVPGLARRSLDFMLRRAPSDLATIDAAFRDLRLAEWLRLIANKAARASIDEVAHLQSDWVGDIFALDRPVRFVHGAEDTLCPVADAAAMAAALPGAVFTRFEGAGHLVLGQRLGPVLDMLFLPQNSSDRDRPQSVYDVV